MAGLVGYHTSSAGGYFNAVKHAKEYGLDTFQFFLGSPRSWRYRDLKKNEDVKFNEAIQNSPFEITTVHMNYLPNPSTPKSDTDLRKKTEESLLEEIRRCDLLDVTNLVFHIGSHKGNGFETARPMVADFLNLGLAQNPRVKLLMEISAGAANSVGSTFEEISEIIELVDDPDKVGICFDTCHAFAAGYDLRDEQAIDETLDHFDSVLGLQRLKVIHANDSKGKLGEGKDRHANLGTGEIGEKGFENMMQHPTLDGIPFILETPGKGLLHDIELLKSFQG